MQEQDTPVLLRDLEALYEASLAAASFGTALKVKELMVRLTQHQRQKTEIPDISTMTDEALETFVDQIKSQLASVHASPVRKMRAPRVKKTTKKLAEKS
jgi:hypothetical protein